MSKNNQFRFYVVSIENKDSKTGEWKRGPYVHSVQPTLRNAKRVVANTPPREDSRLAAIAIPLGPKGNKEGQRMLEESLILALGRFIADKYDMSLSDFYDEALDKLDAYLATRKDEEDED